MHSEHFKKVTKEKLTAAFSLTFVVKTRSVRRKCRFRLTDPKTNLQVGKRGLQAASFRVLRPRAVPDNRASLLATGSSCRTLPPIRKNSLLPAGPLLALRGRSRTRLREAEWLNGSCARLMTRRRLQEREEGRRGQSLPRAHMRARANATPIRHLQQVYFLNPKMK